MFFRKRQFPVFRKAHGFILLKYTANARKDNAMNDQNTVISCVECDAVNCIHNNHQCRCTAKNIKIGTHSACTCSDTVCQSFSAK